MNQGRFCFAFLLWLLLITLVADAASLRWKKILDGVHVWCITPDPEGPFIYLGTVNEGILVTEDRGRSWSKRNNGIPLPGTIVNIAIDPQNAAILYAIRNGDLYKSTDRGLSWAMIKKSVSMGLIINPKNPDIIYAGEYKSEDGGRSWEKYFDGVDGSFPPYRIAIDPKEENTIYVVTFSARAFKSEDGGRSWKRIKVEGEEELYQIVVSPIRDGVLYACGKKGVYKSEDGGERWNLMEGGLPKGASGDFILIDPVDPRIIYVGLRGEGIFRSVDEGESWEPLGEGFQSVGVAGLAISKWDPNYLYASGGGSVWRLELAPRRLFHLVSPLGKLLYMWGGIKMDKGLKSFKKRGEEVWFRDTSS